MTTFRSITFACLIFLLATSALMSGCAPKKYLSASGQELILSPKADNQTGGIDSTVATRCMEGKTEIYSKLFGGRYNPCVELGIFLINNWLPEEGIPLLEKGINASGSYNADESILKTENLGIMQNTQLANSLFEICLNRKIQNLSNGADITADICGKAGELFEKIKYRENAILMYRKKCDLTGKCNDLKRLENQTKP